uniref:Uncharacterized protein n=1 Tax=Trieres chinensis TaxID=1514140 RepID=A0A7S1YWN4_TRICV|mmetsp:Transcript_12402/g.25738  ORF Transcript_12402/g.25738 Transcript_12402/m.25738 type:complete len:173 (+) Transcript_12402:136-654(+)|eukprot:CAMPEP_0183311784 /NCGR_PEP_ID=MMETSP0160_2-20130417/38810_1 /TAXON_ID=2839 ORGANISM="Odontella Sinensis, Strain Grunow 1884" /NCGR_SAMPLE_ID=MMETSP0160_2 /ASSEMBLY_ACC=CAM_ASM_000250 /LENGTH=172 /DNA_ID=CAMNT_0025476477 /DNA_START=101 /DNA_END=619 /DNA_ORIENTATION=+
MLSAARTAATKTSLLRHRAARASHDAASRAFATHVSGKYESGRLYPVYVHPLSQVVLEHLQTARGDWVSRKGLDRGLTINYDGTFTINFRSEYGDDDVSNDAGRIWTSYDAEKKQHWLTVYKDTLLGRYPLKVCKDSSWHTEKYMVQETVDRMIERISEVDRKKEQVCSRLQ